MMLPTLLTIHLFQRMQNAVNISHGQLPFNIGLGCRCKVESIINYALHFSTNGIQMSAPLFWLLAWFSVKNNKDGHVR